MTNRSRWRHVFATPVGASALFAVIVFAVLSALGPALFDARASQVDALAAREGISGSHWLGTDALGRDILARVLVATRLSLGLALGATAVGSGLGVLLGSMPVVLGPRLGRLVSASINLAVAFPGLLLALFLAVIFGLGASGALFAVGLAIAPAMARLTLNLSSSVAGLDYVAAARILGVGRFRLLWRHVLPNIAEPLVINATVTIGLALLAFSGLSFLGLGVQPPSYDWGRMLNEGLDRIFVNPAGALAPGMAIVLAGLSFNMVGDTVAQILGRRVQPRRVDAGGVVQLAPPSPSTQNDGPAEDPLLTVADLAVLAPTTDGQLALVHDVNFDVAPGEAIGIVGESGSGKSLTVLSIAQLLQYPLQLRAQRLSFLGRDLLTESTDEMRRLLGPSLAVVFQDPASALNPAIRVGRQLAEVAEVHQGMARGTAASRAVDRLRAVRIPTPEQRARQFPHEFSGGMRQRATLGLALMGSPRLLIADEPTTGLDVTVQAQILDLLAQVRRESGAAVLLVSHDMAVVSGFCERVLVMYGGTVVEDVSVDQLLKGPAHPYTEALLSTVPEMADDRDKPLATIPGRPPEPHHRPTGCPFSPRCAYATQQCRDERPILVAHHERHRVACWHPLTIERRPK